MSGPPPPSRPGLGRHLALVEDSSIQRKVLGDCLRDLGFVVTALASAPEALEHLVRRRPHVVVSDVVMPGMDGFALCRAIADEPALSSIPVILVTSTDIDDSDQRLAERAGAAALVPRTPGFGLLVEALLACLDRPREAGGHPSLIMAELRARFLADGRAEAPRLVATLDSGGDSAVLRPQVHRWAGRGSTLGFPGISRQARALEAALDRDDRDAARAALAVLGRMFHDTDAGGEPRALSIEAPPAAAAVVPAAIAEGLADRRVALIGFTPSEAERVATVLAQARARAEPVAWREGLAGSAAIGTYDLVVLAAHGEPAWAPWLAPAAIAECEAPLLLVGDPESLLRAAPALHDHQLLLAPWRPEGLLLRSFLALQRPAGNGARQRPTRAPREVVLADDDPTILVLLEATLRNYGYRCHLAEDGAEAIELTRRVRPAALIVDINMPGRDGYEVLSTLRGDRRVRGMPIILLTARHQETDVIRAFDLGASEYIVKPFNPLELVARLRRLVEP